MVSDAQRLANRRYYEKHRAARLEQMRTKARERAAALRERMNEDPELLEAERARGREQYYLRIERNNRKRISEWLEDPGICDTFKAFLRTNVLPQIRFIPGAFLDMCWEYLAVYGADIPAEDTVTEIVDGPTATSAEEAEEEGDSDV